MSKSSSYTPLSLPRVQALQLPSLDRIKFNWTRIEDVPSGVPLRSGSEPIVVEDKIYFFGGRLPSGEKPSDQQELLSKVLVFNTKTSRWEQPLIIDTMCKNRFEPAFAKDNATIIGSIADSICSVNVETGKITTIGPQTFVWATGSARLSSGRVVAWNRRDGTKVYEDQTWKKEPNVENFGEVPWDETAQSLFPIGEIGIFLSSYSNVVRMHDPLFGSWARLPTSPNPIRAYESFFSVRYGPIIVAVRNSSIATLNLITGQWLDHDELPSPKQSLQTDPVLIGNKLYFWGEDKSDCIVVLQIDVGSSWTADQLAQFDHAFSLDARDVLQKVEKPQRRLDEFVEDNMDLTKRDIVANPSLKPHNPERLRLHRKIKQSIPGLVEGTPVALPRFMKHNLPVEDKGNAPLPGHIFHKNLITYLVVVYDAHLSVMLSPDMVFYTLLCELSSAIKSNPEMFARLFTHNPEEKSTVFFFQKEPSEIDLDSLCDQIQAGTPIDSSAFRASFTTTDSASRLAMSAAFADAMGCYMEYVGGLCGIPRVRVLGSKADWQQIEKKLQRWQEIFSPVFEGHSDSRDATDLDWIKLAQECVRDIYTNRDPEFWKSMMSIDRCNCGTTDAIDGWIGRLYRCCRQGRRNGQDVYYAKDFYNFDSHISSVQWTNQETEHKYSLFTGLLYSTIQEPKSELDTKYPFLEPHFAHLIRDETDMKMTPEDYDRYLATLPWGDSNFLKEHLEYLDGPVILRGGSQKERHMHEIILQKWIRLNEAAARGSCKNVRLALSSYDRSFGRLNLPSRYNRNDDQSLVRKMDTKYPLLRRIAEEIGKFVASGPLEMIDAHLDNGLFAFSDIIFRDFARSRVQKVKLEVRYVEELCKLLDASPSALSEVEIQFTNNPDASMINSALLACTSPIKRLKISNCSQTPVDAILSRLIHPTAPLESFDIGWTVPGRTEVYSFLATHAPKIHLKHMQIMLDQEVDETKSTAMTQASDLARFFAANNTVESIDLVWRTQPTLDVKKILIGGLSHSCVKKISLNYAHADGLALLIDGLSALEDLSIVEIAGGDVHALALSVSNLIRSENCRLSQLKLHRCYLRSADISLIMNAISQGSAKHLIRVDFSRNDVDKDTCGAISRALSSPDCPIEYLDLTQSFLKFGDSIEIISALENNCHLRTLRMYASGVGTDEEQIQMVQALGRTLAKNRALERLETQLYVCGAEHMNQLAQQIAENKTIKTLAFLAYTSVAAQLDRVWAILRRNRALAGDNDMSLFSVTPEIEDSEESEDSEDREEGEESEAEDKSNESKSEEEDE